MVLSEQPDRRLLEGPKFHGDVKPVEDVRRRLMEPTSVALSGASGQAQVLQAVQSQMTAAGESPRDFRQASPDLSRIGIHLFGGFRKCLYPVQKFDSNPKRILSVILDGDVDHWFRPNTDQFRIRYRRGSDHLEYVPDFVDETASAPIMLEVKASNQLAESEVKAKADAAREWASHTPKYTSENGGKP